MPLSEIESATGDFVEFPSVYRPLLANDNTTADRESASLSNRLAGKEQECIDLGARLAETLQRDQALLDYCASCEDVMDSDQLKRAQAQARQIPDLKPWRELIGCRLLVSDDCDAFNSTDEVFEVTLLEVSPNGRIKLRYSSGAEIWEDGDDHRLIEILKTYHDPHRNPLGLP